MNGTQLAWMGLVTLCLAAPGCGDDGSTNPPTTAVPSAGTPSFNYIRSSSGGSVTVSGIVRVDAPPGAMPGEGEWVMLEVRDPEGDGLPALPDDTYSYQSRPYAIRPFNTELRGPVRITLGHTLRGSALPIGFEGLSVWRLSGDTDDSWAPVANPTFRDGEASFDSGAFGIFAEAERVELISIEF